jgi:hypothetical protein
VKPLTPLQEGAFWLGVIVICLGVAVLLAGCDSYARATAAPDVTLIVNVPPAPVPQPPSDNSQLPTPNPPIEAPPVVVAPPAAVPAPEPPPPLPPSVPPTVEDCAKHGRGGSNGTPGNGKGWGDENGKGPCK